MHQDITAEELKMRLKNGEKFLFIDVREEWEFDETNIGAKCIPLHSLPNKLEEIGDPAQEIVVHCKSGTRGNQAKKFLQTKGFENVKNLIGGIEAFLMLKN